MASNPIDSTRRQVAVSVIDGYNSSCPDDIMSYRAPNCIHQIMPSSSSRPPMNNSTYSTFWVCTILPHFRNFHVTLHDLIEDAAANKVVLWASSTADTDLGPYGNEYVAVLYFNSEGKVEKFVEFVDSKSVAFFRRLGDLIVPKEGTNGATNNHKLRGKL
ncbi:unnamed protein product [Calypogeia fissa]